MGSSGDIIPNSYDDADRLVKIERRTATGAPQGFSEFVYDYASRKAISREWNYQNGTFVKTEEKRRVFDGMDVVQERNAANEVTAQLVRDGNISGILSRTTAAGASFYGYDGNGNVTLLTDASGADVAHYRYDAWGNTLEAVGPRAGENPYRFSTKEVHAQSGLIDFGYRFYSPSMGRWINRDPLGEAGGVNLYAMVRNNPVNFVDFYGLARVEVRFKGFGVRHAYIIVSENDGSNPYYIRFGPQTNGGFSGLSGSGSSSGSSSSSGGSSSQSSGSTSSSRSGNSSSNSSNSSSTGSSRGGRNKNTGTWGPIDAWVGPYVKGTPDYRTGKDPSITIVKGDNKPTSYYYKKFLADADKIVGANIPYNPVSTNSNASVSELLKMEGLGGKSTKTQGLAPGWSTDLEWWIRDTPNR